MASPNIVLGLCLWFLVAAQLPRPVHCNTQSFIGQSLIVPMTFDMSVVTSVVIQDCTVTQWSATTTSPITPATVLIKFYHTSSYNFISAVFNVTIVGLTVDIPGIIVVDAAYVGTAMFFTITDSTMSNGGITVATGPYYNTTFIVARNNFTLSGVGNVLKMSPYGQLIGPFVFSAAQLIAVPSIDPTSPSSVVVACTNTAAGCTDGASLASYLQRVANVVQYAPLTSGAITADGLAVSLQVETLADFQTLLLTSLTYYWETGDTVPLHAFILAVLPYAGLHALSFTYNTVRVTVNAYGKTVAFSATGSNLKLLSAVVVHGNDVRFDVGGACSTTTTVVEIAFGNSESYFVPAFAMARNEAAASWDDIVTNGVMMQGTSSSSGRVRVSYAPMYTPVDALDATSWQPVLRMTQRLQDSAHVPRGPLRGYCYGSNTVNASAAAPKWWGATSDDPLPRVGPSGAPLSFDCNRVKVVATDSCTDVHGYNYINVYARPFALQLRYVVLTSYVFDASNASFTQPVASLSNTTAAGQLGAVLPHLTTVSAYARRAMPTPWDDVDCYHAAMSIQYNAIDVDTPAGQGTGFNIGDLIRQDVVAFQDEATYRRLFDPTWWHPSAPWAAASSPASDVLVATIMLNALQQNRLLRFVGNLVHIYSGNILALQFGVFCTPAFNVQNGQRSLWLTSPNKQPRVTVAYMLQYGLAATGLPSSTTPDGDVRGTPVAFLGAVKTIESNRFDLASPNALTLFRFDSFPTSSMVRITFLHVAISFPASATCAVSVNLLDVIQTHGYNSVNNVDVLFHASYWNFSLSDPSNCPSANDYRHTSFLHVQYEWQCTTRADFALASLDPIASLFVPAENGGWSAVGDPTTPEEDAGLYHVSHTLRWLNAEAPGSPAAKAAAGCAANPSATDNTWATGQPMLAPSLMMGPSARRKLCGGLSRLTHPHAAAGVASFSNAPWLFGNASTTDWLLTDPTAVPTMPHASVAPCGLRFDHFSFVVHTDSGGDLRFVEFDQALTNVTSVFTQGTFDLRSFKNNLGLVYDSFAVGGALLLWHIDARSFQGGVSAVFVSLSKNQHVSNDFALEVIDSQIGVYITQECQSSQTYVIFQISTFCFGCSVFVVDSDVRLATAAMSSCSDPHSTEYLVLFRASNGINFDVILFQRTNLAVTTAAIPVFFQVDGGGCKSSRPMNWSAGMQLAGIGGQFRLLSDLTVPSAQLTATFAPAAPPPWILVATAAVQQFSAAQAVAARHLWLMENGGPDATSGDGALLDAIEPSGWYTRGRGLWALVNVNVSTHTIGAPQNGARMVWFSTGGAVMDGYILLFLHARVTTLIYSGVLAMLDLPLALANTTVVMKDVVYRFSYVDPCTKDWHSVLSIESSLDGDCRFILEDVDIGASVEVPTTNNGGASWQQTNRSGYGAMVLWFEQPWMHPAQSQTFVACSDTQRQWNYVALYFSYQNAYIRQVVVRRVRFNAYLGCPVTFLSFANVFAPTSMPADVAPLPVAFVSPGDPNGVAAGSGELGPTTTTMSNVTVLPPMVVIEQSFFNITSTAGQNAQTSRVVSCQQFAGSSAYVDAATGSISPIIAVHSTQAYIVAEQGWFLYISGGVFNGGVVFSKVDALVISTGGSNIASAVIQLSGQDYLTVLFLAVDCAFVYKQTGMATSNIYSVAGMWFQNGGSVWYVDAPPRPSFTIVNTVVHVEAVLQSSAIRFETTFSSFSTPSWPLVSPAARNASNAAPSSAADNVGRYNALWFTTAGGIATQRAVNGESAAMPRTTLKGATVLAIAVADAQGRIDFDRLSTSGAPQGGIAPCASPTVASLLSALTSDGNLSQSFGWDANRNRNRVAAVRLLGVSIRMHGGFGFTNCGDPLCGVAMFKLVADTDFLLTLAPVSVTSLTRWTSGSPLAVASYVRSTSGGAAVATWRGSSNLVALLSSFLWAERWATSADPVLMAAYYPPSTATALLSPTYFESTCLGAAATVIFKYQLDVGWNATSLDATIMSNRAVDANAPHPWCLWQGSLRQLTLFGNPTAGGLVTTPPVPAFPFWYMSAPPVVDSTDARNGVPLNLPVAAVHSLSYPVVSIRSVHIATVVYFSDGVGNTFVRLTAATPSGRDPVRVRDDAMAFFATPMTTVAQCLTRRFNLAASTVSLVPTTSSSCSVYDRFGTVVFTRSGKTLGSIAVELNDGSVVVGAPNGALKYDEYSRVAGLVLAEGANPTMLLSASITGNSHVVTFATGQTATLFVQNLYPPAPGNGLAQLAQLPANATQWSYAVAALSVTQQSTLTVNHSLTTFLQLNDRVDATAFFLSAQISQSFVASVTLDGGSAIRVTLAPTVFPIVGSLVTLPGHTVNLSVTISGGSSVDISSTSLMADVIMVDRGSVVTVTMRGASTVRITQTLTNNQWLTFSSASCSTYTRLSTAGSGTQYPRTVSFVDATLDPVALSTIGPDVGGTVINFYPISIVIEEGSAVTAVVGSCGFALLTTSPVPWIRLMLHNATVAVTMSVGSAPTTPLGGIATGWFPSGATTRGFAQVPDPAVVHTVDALVAFVLLLWQNPNQVQTLAGMNWWIVRSSFAFSHSALGNATSPSSPIVAYPRFGGLLFVGTNVFAIGASTGNLNVQTIASQITLANNAWGSMFPTGLQFPAVLVTNGSAPINAIIPVQPLLPLTASLLFDGVVSATAVPTAANMNSSELWSRVPFYFLSRCNMGAGDRLTTVAELPNATQRLPCEVCVVELDCNPQYTVNVSGIGPDNCTCHCRSVPNPARPTRTLPMTATCDPITVARTRSRSLTLAEPPPTTTVQPTTTTASSTTRTTTTATTSSAATTSLPTTSSSSTALPSTSPPVSMTNGSSSSSSFAATTTPRLPLITSVVTVATSNATRVATTPSTAVPPTTVRPLLAVTVGDTASTTALSIVVSQSTARSIAGASTAALAVGSTVNPSSANKGANLANIIASLTCRFDNTSDVSTTTANVWIQVSIGSGMFNAVLGGMVVCLGWVTLGAVGSIAISLALQGEKHHTVRSLMGALYGVLMSFMLPNAVGFAATLANHGALDSSAMQTAGILGCVACFLLWAFPFVICAKIDSSLILRAKKLRDLRSERLYAVIALINGTRRWTVYPLRLAFFEDVGSAMLFSFLGGWFPTNFSCANLSLLMLALSVLHVGYVLILRPYDAIVDNAFAVVIAAVQMLIAIGVTITTFGEDTNGDALRLVGWLALVQNGVFMLQTALMLLVGVVRLVIKYVVKRGKTKPAQSPKDDDGAMNKKLLADAPAIDDDELKDVTAENQRETRDAEGRQSNERPPSRDRGTDRGSRGSAATDAGDTARERPDEPAAARGDKAGSSVRHRATGAGPVVHGGWLVMSPLSAAPAQRSAVGLNGVAVGSSEHLIAEVERQRRGRQEPGGRLPSVRKVQNVNPLDAVEL